MSLAESAVVMVDRVRSRASKDIRSLRGVAAVVGFLLALAAPYVLDGYALSIVLQMLVFVLAVASWNLLAGYFGLFSFAHAALFGVGAYTAVILSAEAGVPPTLALLAGAVGAGLASLPIALPVLRLGGAYVAMVTLAYAEIVYLATIVYRDVTGGPTGYTGHSAMFGGDRVTFFYFVLFAVVVILAGLYVLLISRFGLLARAIRESEDAAQMLGNDTYRQKLLGFVIGSAIGGFAGGLQAFNLLIVSPPMLSIEQMIEFMAMGVIGGLGTFAGPVVGVVAVLGISELLRSFGEIRLLVWGLLLMVIILFFPNGIAGSDVQVRLLRERIADFRATLSDEEVEK